MVSLMLGCDMMYNDWAGYSAAMKAGVQNFIEAQFGGLGDWFSWTCKVCFSFLFPSIMREADIETTY
jgi:hypothetical protein